MAVAGTLEYLISVDSSKLSSGMSNAENKVQSFGNKISAKTVAAGQLIANVATKAASATVSFVKDSVKESRQFDQSMSQVAATLGKTVNEMNETTGKASVQFGNEVKNFEGNLSEFARFMGANTAFSATQAADALNYMALAGYDVQTSMNMLPNVLNLAAAGTMDLATASDMITDTATAFGLTLENGEVDIERTTQLVDEMAKAASTGNTNVQQLGDAFLTVGGLAQELNGGIVNLSDGTTATVDGIQELEIALTAMANAGIKGSEAGTHMRNMLLKLSSPTSDGTKALQDMGVSVFEASGKMRSMKDIFGDLNTSLGKMTQSQKIQAISTLFNTRDLASAEALLAAVGQDWDEIGAAILDADGAAQEMANTQLDNLEGDITKWNSALSETRLTITKGITPALRMLVQKGTADITKLTDAFKENGLRGAIKEAWNILQETFKGGFSKIKLKIADYVGIENGDTASWSTIATGIVTKIGANLKEQKIKIAQYLEIDNAEEASWGQIAVGIVDNIKAKLEGVKLKIADILGMEGSDITLSAVAGQIIGKIKDGLKLAKIKIAEFLDIEEANEATWGDIAGAIKDKITEQFKKAKIKVAEFLDLEGSELTFAAVSGSIIGKIKEGLGKAKIKIAEFLDMDDSGAVTWGGIATNIVDRIKEGLGKVKIKIADFLGIEESSDISWAVIAGSIVGKIKGQLKKTKIKVAELLGVDDADNASWSTIAGNIVDRIKKGFTGVKIKVADLLGIEEKGDLSWSRIAGTIKKKLMEQLDKAKIKIGELFQIDDPSDKSWGDIASKIMNGLSTYFSEKGDFLKQLILGKDFDPDKSTWLDVGQKIAGYIEEAFADGGILNAILTGGAEKLELIGPIAGQLLSGFGDWINKNSGQVVSIVTSIAKAIGEASGPIIQSLATILTDPSLWTGLSDAIEAIGVNLLKTLGLLPEDYENDTGSTPQEVAAGTADTLQKMYEEATTAKGAVTELGTEVEGVAGDYDITFNIKTNGEIPDVASGTHTDEDTGNEHGGGGHGFAKGSWNVPYDMNALLHRGETVLTKSQARKFRNGESGFGNTSAIVKAIQNMRNDLQHMQMVVGEKVFGETVVDYSGNRIDGFIGETENRMLTGYGW